MKLELLPLLIIFPVLFLVSGLASPPSSNPVVPGLEQDIMKETPRAVFVAFMGGFKTPDRSGSWGVWNNPGKDSIRHQPNHLDTDGRRDISSCFYPAIGPYDMSDPDVAEYHCQLLKMAGVDGISFNIGPYQTDPWRQKSMLLFVDAMQRYGLKGIIRYENKFYYKTYPDPQKCAEASYFDMDAWLRCLEPVQYRVADRPIFMLFTFKLTPEQLSAWKEKYSGNAKPFIITVNTNDSYRSAVDGKFGWTGDHPEFLTDHSPYRSYVTAPMALSNSREDLRKANEMLKTQRISFYMVGVSPGFDDIGCWGWGEGPRKVERDDGNVYRSRWDIAVNSGLPVVLIPTWNDWQEGTSIEPSVEYGNRYLELTRDGISHFKGRPAAAGNLMMPVWIYKIRKSTSDPLAIAAMSSASNLIAEGKYGEAEAIVKPWAERLKLTNLQVWNSPLIK